MSEEVSATEVTEGFSLEHGLEVELDVCLADEAGGVSEEAERASVGDDCPEVPIRSVEQFLDHRVGSALRCAGDPSGLAIEVDTPAQEVNWEVVGLVTDRE
ncbi:MAG: hypothetical protein M5U19_14780 [Microthrixaceae bacterium]|nr:hypothetical protein [Microthrixaceae bacterium]